MSLLAARENELFNRWETKREHFFRDGVPNSDGYSSANIKTIFVLREANTGGKPARYDFRNELGVDPSKFNPHRFWKQQMGPWSYGVANYSVDLDVLWPRAQVVKKDSNELKCVLHQFGYIQLKKVGGKSTSNARELETFAAEDADLIREQIGIYNPDVLIACGKGPANTFDLLCKYVFKDSFEELPRLQTKDPRVSRVGKLSGNPVFMMESLHPSQYRVSREVAFKKLVSDFRHVVDLRA